MNIKEKSLTKYRIDLRNDVVNILGPNLELNECEIISNCETEAIAIAGIKMNGGVFEQNRSLVNFNFEKAHFNNVLFKGNYIGCDFGDWDLEERSSISNCDFSLALLDGCRFLRCDPNYIQFPKWPCFTIISPCEARQYVLSRNWPEKIGVILSIYTDTDPECVAVTGDALRIAKKNKITLLELRELLLKIPNILIVD